MTQTEFIARHGQDAWNMLVEPRTQEPWTEGYRKLAAGLVDWEICQFLLIQRLPNQGLLAARPVYDNQSYTESWDDFLARTIFSKTHTGVIFASQAEIVANFD